MYQTNCTHQVRTPKGHVDYADWELDVLKAVNGNGVTVEQLAHIIKRSHPSITKKAGQMGVSLKAIKGNNKAAQNKKIFKLIESLGLATVTKLIEDSGIPESSVRSCLRILVKDELVKYKKNESGGYIYYI